MLLTYEYLTSSVDKGCITFLISFDSSKAFDKVCLMILLKNLEMGISGTVLHWLAEILKHRTMKVKNDGDESSSLSFALFI